MHLRWSGRTGSHHGPLRDGSLRSGPLDESGGEHVVVVAASNVHCECWLLVDADSALVGLGGGGGSAGAATAGMGMRSNDMMMCDLSLACLGGV